MDLDQRRNRQLIVGLTASWLLITTYSALLVPEFWYAACIFTISLAYSFYYAWSRVSRGSGQAGIVVIKRDSTTLAKWSADLAMLFTAVVSLLALLGHNDLLLRVFARG